MKNIELTREASGIIMEVEKLLIGEDGKNIVVIMFNQWVFGTESNPFSMK